MNKIQNRNLIWKIELLNMLKILEDSLNKYQKQ